MVNHEVGTADTIDDLSTADPTTQTVLFENGERTPAVGSSEFLPGDWDALRDAGISPVCESVLDDSWEQRQEFLGGCRMMGLIGRRKSLKPQQLRLADVLNANRRFSSVLLPRRSAKTTSLFAWALGRCMERDDYLIAYTVCTTGKKARDRFMKDVVPILERVYPDKDSRPFKIRTANGLERVVFDNGSIFQICKPNGEDFRSDAYDVIILDEGGEADPEMGDDIIEAALPTQDTREQPMLIVAGTAAKYRKSNVLWDALEDGRAGPGNTAILEYAAPDTTTEHELAAWEPDEDHPEARVRELVELHHPGVGTLTTLDAIRVNFGKMKPEQFQREYLGIFGVLGTSGGLIDMTKWENGLLPGDLPEPPERFALAIAAHPNQTTSTIVAVWREGGAVRILMLDKRRGVKWLSGEAARLALKYRTPVVHDTNGPVMVEVEILGRMKRRPAMEAQSFPDIKTAAALLIKEIDTENVGHWGQAELTDAARLTRKRRVGPTAWALGREHDEDDITPMEAAAMALRVYDAMPVHEAKSPIFAA